MSATPEDIKTLTIKTGSVKRCHKELTSYEKEVEKESSKVEKLKESGADAYDIKQAENVLTESKMMIRDTRQRLEAALGDLQNLLAELDSLEGLKERDEWKAAQEVLEAAQKVLE